MANFRGMMGSEQMPPWYYDPTDPRSPFYNPVGGGQSSGESGTIRTGHVVDTWAAFAAGMVDTKKIHKEQENYRNRELEPFLHQIVEQAQKQSAEEAQKKAVEEAKEAAILDKQEIERKKLEEEQKQREREMLRRQEMQKQEQEAARRNMESAKSKAEEARHASEDSLNKLYNTEEYKTLQSAQAQEAENLRAAENAKRAFEEQEREAKRAQEALEQQRLAQEKAQKTLEEARAAYNKDLSDTAQENLSKAIEALQTIGASYQTQEEEYNQAEENRRNAQETYQKLELERRQSSDQVVVAKNALNENSLYADYRELNDKAEKAQQELYTAMSSYAAASTFDDVSAMVSATQNQIEQLKTNESVAQYAALESDRAAAQSAYEKANIEYEIQKARIASLEAADARTAEQEKLLSVCREELNKREEVLSSAKSQQELAISAQQEYCQFNDSPELRQYISASEQLNEQNRILVTTNYANVSDLERAYEKQQELSRQAESASYAYTLVAGAGESVKDAQDRLSMAQSSYEQAQQTFESRKAEIQYDSYVNRAKDAEAAYASAKDLYNQYQSDETRSAMEAARTEYQNADSELKKQDQLLSVCRQDLNIAKDELNNRKEELDRYEERASIINSAVTADAYHDVTQMHSMLESTQKQIRIASGDAMYEDVSKAQEAAAAAIEQSSLYREIQDINNTVSQKTMEEQAALNHYFDTKEQIRNEEAKLEVVTNQRTDAQHAYQHAQAEYEANASSENKAALDNAKSSLDEANREYREQEQLLSKRKDELHIAEETLENKRNELSSAKSEQEELKSRSETDKAYQTAVAAVANVAAVSAAMAEDSKKRVSEAQSAYDQAVANSDVYREIQTESDRVFQIREELNYKKDIAATYERNMTEQKSDLVKNMVLLEDAQKALKSAQDSGNETEIQKAQDAVDKAREVVAENHSQIAKIESNLNTVKSNILIKESEIDKATAGLVSMRAEAMKDSAYLAATNAEKQLNSAKNRDHIAELEQKMLAEAEKRIPDVKTVENPILFISEEYDGKRYVPVEYTLKDFTDKKGSVNWEKLREKVSENFEFVEVRGRGKYLDMVDKARMSGVKVLSAENYTNFIGRNNATGKGKSAQVMLVAKGENLKKFQEAMKKAGYSSDAGDFRAHENEDDVKNNNKADKTAIFNWITKEFAVQDQDYQNMKRFVVGMVRNYNKAMEDTLKERSDRYAGAAGTLMQIKETQIKSLDAKIAAAEISKTKLEKELQAAKQSANTMEIKRLQKELADKNKEIRVLTDWREKKKDEHDAIRHKQEDIRKLQAKLKKGSLSESERLKIKEDLARKTQDLEKRLKELKKVSKGDKEDSKETKETLAEIKKAYDKKVVKANDRKYANETRRTMGKLIGRPLNALKRDAMSIYDKDEYIMIEVGLDVTKKLIEIQSKTLTALRNKHALRLKNRKDNPLTLRIQKTRIGKKAANVKKKVNDFQAKRTKAKERRREALDKILSWTPVGIYHRAKDAARNYIFKKTLAGRVAGKIFSVFNAIKAKFAAVIAGFFGLLFKILCGGGVALIILMLVLNMLDFTISPEQQIMYILYHDQLLKAETDWRESLQDRNVIASAIQDDQFRFGRYYLRYEDYVAMKDHMIYFDERGGYGLLGQDVENQIYINPFDFYPAYPGEYLTRLTAWGEPVPDPSTGSTDTTTDAQLFAAPGAGVMLSAPYMIGGGSSFDIAALERDYDGYFLATVLPNSDGTIPTSAPEFDPNSLVKYRILGKINKEADASDYLHDRLYEFKYYYNYYVLGDGTGHENDQRGKYWKDLEIGNSIAEDGTVNDDGYLKLYLMKADAVQWKNGDMFMRGQLGDTGILLEYLPNLSKEAYYGNSGHTSNIKDIICMADVLFQFEAKNDADTADGYNMAADADPVEIALDYLWEKISQIGKLLHNYFFKGDRWPADVSVADYKRIRSYCMTLFEASHQEMVDIDIILFDCTKTTAASSLMSTTDEMGLGAGDANDVEYMDTKLGLLLHDGCPMHYDKDGNLLGGCQESDFYGVIYTDVYKNMGSTDIYEKTGGDLPYAPWVAYSADDKIGISQSNGQGHMGASFAYNTQDPYYTSSEYTGAVVTRNFIASKLRLREGLGMSAYHKQWVYANNSDYTDQKTTRENPGATSPFGPNYNLVGVSADTGQLMMGVVGTAQGNDSELEHFDFVTLTERNGFGDTETQGGAYCLPNSLRKFMRFAAPGTETMSYGGYGFNTHYGLSLQDMDEIMKNTAKGTWEGENTPTCWITLTKTAQELNSSEPYGDSGYNYWPGHCWIDAEHPGKASVLYVVQANRVCSDSGDGLDGDGTWDYYEDYPETQDCERADVTWLDEDGLNNFDLDRDEYGPIDYFDVIMGDKGDRIVLGGYRWIEDESYNDTVHIRCDHHEDVCVCNVCDGDGGSNCDCDCDDCSQEAEYPHEDEDCEVRRYYKEWKFYVWGTNFTMHTEFADDSHGVGGGSSNVTGVYASYWDQKAGFTDSYCDFDNWGCVNVKAGGSEGGFHWVSTDAGIFDKVFGTGRDKDSGVAAGDKGTRAPVGTCLGHTCRFCGGHSIINVKGIIFSFTDDEIIAGAGKTGGEGTVAEGDRPLIPVYREEVLSELPVVANRKAWNLSGPATPWSDGAYFTGYQPTENSLFGRYYYQDIGLRGMNYQVKQDRPYMWNDEKINGHLGPMLAGTGTGSKYTDTSYSDPADKNIVSINSVREYSDGFQFFFNSPDDTEEVNKVLWYAQDIFDIDAGINYPQFFFPNAMDPRDYEGWTESNMLLALLKYNMSWEDTYSFDIPVNMGTPQLSEDQISTILDAIQPVSGDQRKALELALQAVGNGQYSQLHHSHGYLMGDCHLYTTGGKQTPFDLIHGNESHVCTCTDASGFTSYVMNVGAAGGTVWTTEDFKNNANVIYSVATMKPGDIVICYPNYTEDEEGYYSDTARHTMVYLGTPTEDIKLTWFNQTGGTRFQYYVNDVLQTNDDGTPKIPEFGLVPNSGEEVRFEPSTYITFPAGKPIFIDANRLDQRGNIYLRGGIASETNDYFYLADKELMTQVNSGTDMYIYRPSY